LPRSTRTSAHSVSRGAVRQDRAGPPRPVPVFRIFLVLASTALFFVLARAVLQGSTAAWDAQIRTVLHAHASPALTRLMLVITTLGEVWFLAPFCCAAAILLLRAGLRRDAILFAMASGGSEVLDQLLKLFFHRVRPAAFFGLTSPANYSFPSGHAVTSVAIYGMLAALLAARIRSRVIRRALWAAAALLILSVGATRIYLGVHWPTDVLGGFLAGLAWLLALPAGSQAYRTTNPNGGRPM
jgi:membrane-associated phospholipid phosphatase